MSGGDGGQDLGDGHLANYYTDYLSEHGLRDGQSENDFSYDDPIPFPRSRFPPSQINAMHANSDVDSSQQAQHHTIGPRHNQSAAGDHVHDGVGSKALGIWKNYTIAWSCVSGTQPSLGNGLLAGRYMQLGGAVFGRITFAAGSTTTFGSGSWQFTMPPVPLLAQSGFSGISYEGGIGVALASNGSGGSPLQATSSYRGVVAADLWINAVQILSDNMYWGGNGSSPWAWTATSGFQANFMYEAKPVS